MNNVGDMMSRPAKGKKTKTVSTYVDIGGGRTASGYLDVDDDVRYHFTPDDDEEDARNSAARTVDAMRKGSNKGFAGPIEKSIRQVKKKTGQADFVTDNEAETSPVGRNPGRAKIKAEK
jgi:hypothetical protein